MSSKLVTDIRADLERFRSGADPTLDVEDIEDLIAEYERLWAAAMKMDGYWINDTYDPSTKNVIVRESAFAELRDLLGLQPKAYP